MFSLLLYLHKSNIKVGTLSARFVSPSEFESENLRYRENLKTMFTRNKWADVK